MLLTQPSRHIHLHLLVLHFLPLLWQRELVGSEGQNGRFIGYKPCSVFLFVVGENCSVFFVDKRIIAVLSLRGFNGFEHPLLKFEMFCVGSTVKPEFEELVTLPKLLRSGPENLSALLRECPLVGVIVLGVVWLETSCVAVLVEKEFGEIVVFEGELEAGGLVVVEGEEAFSEGVDHPLRL